jgi:hypothetical protein
MAVTNVAQHGTQNFAIATQHQRSIMSAAPARPTPGFERAVRPPVLPRQVSGPVHDTAARRPEPRRERGDDFLQRLRESGL